MPKLMPYSRELAYGYAPGVFPSHALLTARPGCARRLLTHSSAENSEGVLSLRARCEALGVRSEVADHALSRISKKENCFAAIVFEKYVSALSQSAPQVVLHQPSDMGNLGTIFRACLGFGIKSVAILRPAADAFDPRVVRSSMGALFSLDIAYFDDFEAYRAAYPAHALYPFMLSGSMPLRAAAKAPKTPYALVFGNEATGLPDRFAALGEAVRIPHSGAIDSLNLAVAVSIAVYAFTETSF